MPHEVADNNMGNFVFDFEAYEAGRKLWLKYLRQNGIKDGTLAFGWRDLFEL